MMRGIESRHELDPTLLLRDTRTLNQRLADFFSRHTKYTGFLYIGYPIIGTTEGPFPIDALLVSKDKGLVIFNLIEGKQLDNYKEAQDDSANKLEHNKHQQP